MGSTLLKAMLQGVLQLSSRTFEKCILVVWFSVRLFEAFKKTTEISTSTGMNESKQEVTSGCGIVRTLARQGQHRLPVIEPHGRSDSSLSSQTDEFPNEGRPGYSTMQSDRKFPPSEI